MNFAQAALGDREHIDKSVAVNRAGMTQLTKGFKALGLDYIPSVGNFVCVDVGHPGAEVDAALLREGCIVRPIAAYEMPQHLRVTIGLKAENARFLAALKKVLEL